MRKVVPIAMLAVLAGCNREPQVSLTNASAEEVAAKVKESGSGGLGMKPGRWESKVELVSIDAPNMPPQALQTMRAAFANNGATASCLTEEEAKKPAADFLTGGQADGCRYEKFELGNGRIESRMQCSGPGQPGVSMAMTGTYAAESFAMNMTTRTTAGGAGAMTMTMKVDARRTGNCNGTEKA